MRGYGESADVVGRHGLASMKSCRTLVTSNETTNAPATFPDARLVIGLHRSH